MMGAGDPHLVVLAGGISSRMRRSAAADPNVSREVAGRAKAMIGVGGRPFLDHLLANAAAAGYRDVLIVVGERDRSIREYYGSGERVAGLSIAYATQPIPEGRSKPLGTADALDRALRARPDWTGRSCTVCNSDNLYSVRALRMLLETDAPNALIDYDRQALQFDQRRIEAFAVVDVDPDGFLRDIVEKPSPEVVERLRAPGGRVGVSMNIWRFSRDRILPYLAAVPEHPVRHERELPAAVAMMVADNPRSVRALPLAEHVPDLTSAEDIGVLRSHLGGDTR